MVTVTCVSRRCCFWADGSRCFRRRGRIMSRPLIFGLAGLVSLCAGLNPARPMDRFTLPGGGAGVVRTCRAVSRWRVRFPGDQCDRHAAVLVLRQNARLLLFVYIWVRGTLPRFRYDQLMRFAWTFMFPVGMVATAGHRGCCGCVSEIAMDIASIRYLRRDRRVVRRSIWWCRRIPSPARCR